MDATAPAIEAPAPWTPFEDLPPTLRREVEDRVGGLVVKVVTGVALFCLVLGTAFAFLVGPGTPAAAGVGFFLMGLFLAMLVPVAASAYLLAFPFGAWSAFLPTARLGELYGIRPDQLANPAIRKRMGGRGYWASALGGLVVTGGTSALSILALEAAMGRHYASIGFVLAVGLVGNGIMVRSWMIRRLVAEAEVAR